MADRWAAHFIDGPLKGERRVVRSGTRTLYVAMANVFNVASLSVQETDPIDGVDYRFVTGVYELEDVRYGADDDSAVAGIYRFVGVKTK